MTANSSTATKPYAARMEIYRMRASGTIDETKQPLVYLADFASEAEVYEFVRRVSGMGITSARWRVPLESESFSN
jgi:hypothetical protein